MMKALTRTLLIAGAALVTAGVPVTSFADGDGWRHERFEHHDGWRHRHHDGRVVIVEPYVEPYAVYAAPPVVYRQPYPAYVPAPVYVPPPVYYRPARPTVAISAPGLFIGF